MLSSSLIIIYFIQRVRDIGIAMIVCRQWRAMLGDIVPRLFISTTAPLNHLIALMDNHVAAVIPWVQGAKIGSRFNNEACPATRRSALRMKSQRVKVEGHCYDRGETTEQVLYQVQ